MKWYPSKGWCCTLAIMHLLLLPTWMSHVSFSFSWLAAPPTSWPYSSKCAPSARRCLDLNVPFGCFPCLGVVNHPICVQDVPFFVESRVLLGASLWYIFASLLLGCGFKRLVFCLWPPGWHVTDEPRLRTTCMFSFDSDAHSLHRVETVWGGNDVHTVIFGSFFLALPVSFCFYFLNIQKKNCYLIFLKATLLRYNWHIIKFTHSKCTLQPFSYIHRLVPPSWQANEKDKYMIALYMLNLKIMIQMYLLTKQK